MRTRVIGALLLVLCAPSSLAQQADLVIENGRVAMTASKVLDGHVAMRSGRIVAVGPGDFAGDAARTLDAAGAMIMAGLIDTHRHLMSFQATNDAELERYIETELPEILSELLASGITTVMTPGDHAPHIYGVRARVNSGQIAGPRLIAAGPVFTAPGGHPASTVCRGEPYCRSRVVVEVDDPEIAHAKTLETVRAGAEMIKVVVQPLPGPEHLIKTTVLKEIARGARDAGVPLTIHVARTSHALLAVEMGAVSLVHTPDDEMSDAAIEILRSAGMKVSTTVSWSSEAVAQAVGRPWRAANHRQTLANIRRMRDAGVVTAFGTDNPFPLPLAEFMVEARALATVLSPAEVVASLTSDAATWLDMDDELGSLEVGKVGDLVVVAGDPLTDVEALTRVQVVVQNGEVVFDHR